MPITRAAPGAHGSAVAAEALRSATIGASGGPRRRAGAARAARTDMGTRTGGELATARGTAGAAPSAGAGRSSGAGRGSGEDGSDGGRHGEGSDRQPRERPRLASGGDIDLEGVGLDIVHRRRPRRATGVPCFSETLASCDVERECGRAGGRHASPTWWGWIRFSSLHENASWLLQAATGTGKADGAYEYTTDLDIMNLCHRKGLSN
ncbi:unnamed protein product [Prorocentrum cordatum]|uniref:Uncharacterized protein n=1 Tax=Prorocentrum cordatum TaxID=2364126 RepID=A0ABN9V9F7_9DINO|nr:unnamed protein product [Polarella glacialis]